MSAREVDAVVIRGDNRLDAVPLFVSRNRQDPLPARQDDRFVHHEAFGEVPGLGPCGVV